MKLCMSIIDAVIKSSQTSRSSIWVPKDWAGGAVLRNVFAQRSFAHHNTTVEWPMISQLVMMQPESESRAQDAAKSDRPPWNCSLLLLVSVSYSRTVLICERAKDRARDAKPAWDHGNVQSSSPAIQY